MDKETSSFGVFGLTFHMMMGVIAITKLKPIAAGLILGMAIFLLGALGIISLGLDIS